MNTSCWIPPFVGVSVKTIPFWSSLDLQSLTFFISRTRQISAKQNKGCSLVPVTRTEPKDSFSNNLISISFNEFEFNTYPALLPTTYTLKGIGAKSAVDLVGVLLIPRLPREYAVMRYYVVGLLLSAGGTEQEFAYYNNHRRAILSFRCLRGSERLALMEPIA